MSEIKEILEFFLLCSAPFHCSNVILEGEKLEKWGKTNGEKLAEMNSCWRAEMGRFRGMKEII